MYLYYCKQESFVNPKISLRTIIFSLFAPLLLTVYFYFPQPASALYFEDTITIAKTGQPPLFSQIAATEDGNVYVVWVDKNRVYLRASYDNGTEFGSPTALSSNNSIATSPQIAATEDGNVYVVWVDKNNTSGDTDIVFASTYRGENITSSKILSEDAAGSPSSLSTLLSSSPQIAATEDGNVYVVWVDKDSTSGDTDIVFGGSTNGGENFSRKVLSRDQDIQLLSSFSPQITATKDGNMYVVWVDKNSTSGDTDVVFLSTYRGENFSRTKALSTDIQLSSSSPQITATKDGNVYVVWVDKNSTSGDTDIVFRGSTNNGEKFGRKVLSRDAGPSSLSLALSPQIAATENGRVYVGWIDKDTVSGETSIVFSAISNNGERFTTKRIADFDASLALPSMSPKIAASEIADIYAVWVGTVTQFIEISEDPSLRDETCNS